MNSDYEQMVEAYSRAGGDAEALQRSGVAHLVVQGNQVLGRNAVPGLILETQETPDGVDLSLTVQQGVKLAAPVHLCFGVLPKEGEQHITLKALIERGARVSLLAHCVFPNAVRIVHKMDADIRLEENAHYDYAEAHYHGEEGGAEVLPKARVQVGRGSTFTTVFSLLQGSVGTLGLEYEADGQDDSRIEMMSKVYGRARDRIRIREVGLLAGRGACGLLKSRIALRNEADCTVVNELTAAGPESKGHVDCVEIVKDRARAQAIPIVKVTDESARVTHEAAIGRVDRQQVQTLMARGLDEEQAIDLIVGGLLK